MTTLLATICNSEQYSLKIRDEKKYLFCAIREKNIIHNFQHLISYVQQLAKSVCFIVLDVCIDIDFLTEVLFTKTERSIFGINKENT